MGTAIKHPVPDRVKPSFVIFDIQALWRSERQSAHVKNYKWRFNPVWHRMLYSCTHMATVGVKGLNGNPPIEISTFTLFQNNKACSIILFTSTLSEISVIKWLTSAPNFACQLTPLFRCNVIEYLPCQNNYGSYFITWQNNHCNFPKI